MSGFEICEKYGFDISKEEVRWIEEYTKRKCEVNGRGESYFPVLFENEVRDYLVRRCVNGING